MTKASAILIFTGKNAIRLGTLWMIKLFLFLSTPVFGQAYVSIFVDTTQPDTVHLCKGDTLNFNTSGEYVLINNNFNSGEVGYGWSYVSPNVIFQAPCDTLMYDSYYLWFGEQTTTERALTTLDLNMSGGGEISFSMKFGVQGDVPSCEGPDEAREGVSLQYSNDFGASWNDIIYFCPNGQTMSTNPMTQNPLTYFPTSFCSWNSFTFVVPPAAQTQHTRFRWTQLMCSFYSGHYDDNWGLDNIKISQNAGPDIQIGSSTGSLLNTQLVGDTTTTIYAWIMTSTVPPDTAALDSLVVIVHEIPASIISGDNEICAGESVSFSASGNYTFNWSNGQTGSSISFSPPFSQQLILYIESEFGCKSQAAIEIVVNQLPVAVAGNITVCEGLNATLTASGGTEYLWSNGQSGSQIVIPEIHSDTTMMVTVSDINGCSNTAICNVYVLSAPDPGIPDEISSCYGKEVVLSVSGWPEYLWSNGSHSSSITIYPVSSAYYSVTVTDPNGCVKTDSTLVLVSPRYETSAYSETDTVCLGESVTLHAEGGVDYEWNNGKSTADIVVNPDNQTFYTVTVTNIFNEKYCTSEITVPVEVTECYNLYFANAFSPKGYNNLFRPIGELGVITDYTFMIFDRWGKTVFETNDPYAGWDGKSNGEYASDGVYVWKVRFTMKQARRIYEKMGSVIIVE